MKLEYREGSKSKMQEFIRDRAALLLVGMIAGLLSNQLKVVGVNIFSERDKNLSVFVKAEPRFSLIDGAFDPTIAYAEDQSAGRVLGRVAGLRHYIAWMHDPASANIYGAWVGGEQELRVAAGFSSSHRGANSLLLAVNDTVPFLARKPSEKEIRENLNILRWRMADIEHGNFDLESRWSNGPSEWPMKQERRDRPVSMPQLYVGNFYPRPEGSGSSVGRGLSRIGSFGSRTRYTDVDYQQRERNGDREIFKKLFPKWGLILAPAGLFLMWIGWGNIRDNLNLRWAMVSFFGGCILWMYGFARLITL
jgi:hypothetical protein